MVSCRTFTEAAAAGGLAASAALLPLAPAAAKPVSTERTACAAAEAQVAAHYQFPVSKFGSCDPIVRSANPKGYIIVGLHGLRSECGGCGSTLIGWFAVRRSDGRVFEWDVAWDRLGKPVSLVADTFRPRRRSRMPDAKK